MQHNKFSDPQEEATIDMQHVIIHNKANNDVDEESFSTSFILELQINCHEQVRHLPLDSFQVFHIYHNHFQDIIRTWLESSFSQRFPESGECLLLLAMNYFLDATSLSIFRSFMRKYFSHLNLCKDLIFL